ncbi:hypothetical protein MRX96_013801 [Rhipicephalus microplus]
MTPATKNRPPLRPTCRSDFGARPPQRSFLSFQAEYSRYKETTRESHEAIMRSTADAVVRQHRGCLESQGGFNSWSKSWRDPHCVSSMGTKRATDENVADRKVAIARRCCNVAMTNTWSLRDGASVNSKESGAFPQHLSEKMTNKKTSRFQKVNSSDAISVMTSMADAVVRRHCDCLEHQGCLKTRSTSWQGPHWVSSMRTDRDTDENVADGRVAEARPCPHVKATTTSRLHDGASVNSEGSKAFSPHFSEKATIKKTSRLQNMNSSNNMRVVTLTADAAARRQRGCLKPRGGFNTWSTSWQDPHWVAITRTNCAADKNDACGKVAVARLWRHVATTNTWRTQWRFLKLGRVASFPATSSRKNNQEDFSTTEGELWQHNECRQVNGRCGGERTLWLPGTSRRL